jgi:hypothetical protein
MRHRFRWILLALIAVVVAGAVALVVLEKPTLDDNRDAVDARWAALRAPLVTRYGNLDTALAAFAAAGGGDRSVAKDLQAELAAWKKAVADGDAAKQVEIANQLEGDGLRLRGNVLASPRIAAVSDVTTKLAGFDGSAPPAALVRAYNTAVRTYQDDREDTLRRPLTWAFGFDARPLLVTSG